MKALGIVFVVAVLVLGTVALADRTVVYHSAGAEVVSMNFLPLADGGIRATVCGRTRQDDAGFSPESCYTVHAAGQTRADINAFKAARALPFWIQQEGL